jgi:hypothetical protein
MSLRPNRHSSIRSCRRVRRPTPRRGELPNPHDVPPLFARENTFNEITEQHNSLSLLRIVSRAVVGPAGPPPLGRGVGYTSFERRPFRRIFPCAALTAGTAPFPRSPSFPQALGIGLALQCCLKHSQ